MKKAVIFGAGELGEVLCFMLKATSDVICVVDNDSNKWGDVGKFWDNIPVKSPSVLLAMDYDVVYIACKAGLEQIHSQLRDELHVPENKIDLQLLKNHLDTDEKIILPRIQFAESYAAYVYAHNIQGSVAEAGVYRGHFAKVINRVFPDKRLYLFDTFEGFDERDFTEEQDKNENHDHLTRVGLFSLTSEDAVLKKMPHPENCVIKKGYFPDTFDVENETFCFVNLDMDLYKPIKAGLELFYPLMSRGGVILIHDYQAASNGLYQSSCDGVTAAVDEFVSENRLVAMPIGDYLSAAIIKM